MVSSFVRQFALAFIFLQFQWPNFDCRLKDLQFDLVVALKGSMIIWKEELEGFDGVDGLQQTMDHLPDYFDFGDDKVRLALVTCRNQSCSLDFGFTGDFPKFTAALKAIEPKTKDPKLYMTWDLDTPLKFVRENFLPSPNRQLVVFLVSGFHEWRVDQAKMEASELRSKGVWLYLSVSENLTSFPDFVEMTGSQDKTFFAKWPWPAKEKENSKGNFTKVIFEKIRNDIDKEFCIYDETCAFQESNAQKCAGQWWNPKVNETSGDCSEIRPQPSETPSGSCPPESCEQNCNESWKWSDAACENCAVKNRSSPKPPRKIFENCLHEMPCPCKSGKGPDKSEKGTEMWVYAAIVAGIVLFVGLVSLVIVAVFTIRTKRKAKSTTETMKSKGKAKRKGAKASAPEPAPAITSVTMMPTKKGKGVGAKPKIGSPKSDSSAKMTSMTMVPTGKGKAAAKKEPEVEEKMTSVTMVPKKKK